MIRLGARLSATALAFCCLLPACRREPAPVVEAAAEAAPPPLSPADDETVAIDLYFPGEGGRLYLESRQRPAGNEVAERAGAIVTELINGPQRGSLQAPLPAGVGLGAVYLMEEGELVVDLVSAQGAPPSTGSLREMLTVYSLVNSLLLNLEGAERATLLWNGRQRLTFAGHLDTTRPLVPNTDLVARLR